MPVTSVSPHADKESTTGKATDDFHTFGLRIDIGFAGPMRGMPFQADFEEIHTRKSTNEVLCRRGSLAMDSQGRTRQDVFLPDPENPSTTRHLSIIWDWDTLTYYFIDQQTREVKKFEVGRMHQEQLAGKPKPEGGPSECPLPTSRPSPVVRHEKILGEKLIEGVLCRGTLYTDEPGDRTIEHWFSNRLSHPVLEITREKDAEIVYRLFNIRLVEPEASLFVVP